MGFGGKSALRVWTKLQDCASKYYTIMCPRMERTQILHYYYISKSGKENKYYYYISKSGKENK